MVNKNQLFVIGVLAILLLNISFTGAITGAMGNAKMVLYPEVNGWTNTVIEKSILVKNVNDVPINVTLEVDKDSKDFIELIDNFYVLQPNTEERAQFIIRVRKEGTYNGRINVFFRDSVNEKEAGVALSSEIIIIAKKDQGYDEDEDDQETDDDQDSDSTITGSIINNEEKEPINKLALLAGSSFLLLVILLVLILVLSKKSKKKGNKLNDKKKK